MPSPYICPRCERPYERFWLWSGRCDGCGVRLEPAGHPLLRERKRRGETVEEVDLEGWPAFARGVRLWRATRNDVIPTPPSDLLVELPSGEVSRLERREQLASGVMAITTAQQALEYARFRQGCLPGHNAYGQGGLAPLARQEPLYIEPVRRLLVLHEVFEITGLDGSQAGASVRECHEGGERWFEIERHVLPREALPTEPDRPCTVGSLLRLDESVWPDGRYACQTSEFPPPETDYRRDAARSLTPLTVVMTERRYLKGRPLQIDGLPVVARLRGGRGWG